jgi:hypothetical protein
MSFLSAYASIVILVRSPSNCRPARPGACFTPLCLKDFISGKSIRICTHHKLLHGLILPRSLTVALMSRITLHLRRFAHSPNNVLTYDNNVAHQPHIRPPHPHQTFLSTVSQSVMSFAPPSPTSPPPPPPPPPLKALPSIYPPPQQPKVRPLPPTPRNGARGTVAPSLSSLESGSNFGMDTFSITMRTEVPAEKFRM